MDQGEWVQTEGKSGDVACSETGKKCYLSQQLFDLKGNLRFYFFMPLIQGLVFYLLESDKCECLSSGKILSLKQVIDFSGYLTVGCFECHGCMKEKQMHFFKGLYNLDLLEGFLFEIYQLLHTESFIQKWRKRKPIGTSFES